MALVLGRRNKRKTLNIRARSARAAPQAPSMARVTGPSEEKRHNGAKQQKQYVFMKIMRDMSRKRHQRSRREEKKRRIVLASSAHRKKLFALNIFRAVPPLPAHAPDGVDVRSVSIFCCA